MEKEVNSLFNYPLNLVNGKKFTYTVSFSVKPLNSFFGETKGLGYQFKIILSS